MTKKPKTKPHEVPTPASNEAATVQNTFCGPHRKLPPVKALADEDVPLLDRLLHATMGRVYGLSPAALDLTYADWMTHLALASGKQAELAGSATDKMTRLADFILRQSYGSQPMECCAEPLPQDRRFVDPGWNEWPFNLCQQGLLLTERWWQEAINVRGMSQHHAAVRPFIARQILDMWSPINFPLTNPRIMKAAAA